MKTISHKKDHSYQEKKMKVNTGERSPFSGISAVWSHIMMFSSIVLKTPRNILKSTRVNLMVIGEVLGYMEEVIHRYSTCE